MPDISRFYNICMFCNGSPGQCRCGKPNVITIDSVPPMTLKEWLRETGDADYDDIIYGSDT